ncbi:MAG: hypothetical protein OXH45_05720 [Gammaproteobacteria bacterium]|nr:hypothetical protein [Gammaproteobacteria bacterium]MYH33434.1 hypothetical protein [Gammaproteobacteria bacterium]
MSWPVIDPLAHMLIALFLAGFFLAGGLHKFRAFERFVSLLGKYDIVRSDLLVPAAGLIVAVEATIGFALLTSLLSPQLQILEMGGFAAGAALLFAYLLLMAYSLARGNREIDCGCSFRKQRSLISNWHLCRNGVLILICLAGLLPVRARAMQTIDWLHMPLMLLAAAMLYVLVDTLLANRSYLTPNSTA